MKTLKITLVAIFSIALLTGVSTFNDTKVALEKTNKEVKQVDIKLLANTGIKKGKVPTQG